jgi:hypothetical protein
MAKRTEKIDAKQRHEQRFSWFVAEAHRQAANRAMRAKCERYYDSEQIDSAVRAEIEERGQVVVVHNEIKPSIDWLVGTERRQRIDFHVMPREAMDRESTADAENKTKLLKWLTDINRAGFERSQAFDDAMKSGLGWIETGVRGDQSDVPIYIACSPWRDMLHDSIGSQRLDVADGRYIFRIRAVDYDIAQAYFPGKEEQLAKVRQSGDGLRSFGSWLGGTGNLLDLGLLSGSANDDEDDYAVPTDLFNPRERVLLVECWSVEPNGGQPRPDAPSVYDRAQMSMRCSIMTEYDTLLESWSPYKHGRFPFVPVWAYRNKRTGLPYSPIRPLLDKQDALNGAMSKALHEASVNLTLAEETAFSKSMTPEQVHTEVQDPNGLVILGHGALAGGRFKTERGIDRSRGQLMMAEQLRLAIREGSAVTEANKGRDTNATSGKAIGLQQDQGSILSTELFDNLLLARQLEGEIVLSLSEQYITEPRVISLSGERRQSQIVEINKPMPDGTILNDITARSAQFVVGEQQWRQTLAHAAFESMMELLGNLAQTAPQVVVACLDLVLEFADVPNKEALLERVRAVTGQPGPDNQQSPEQQAQAAQAQAMQQKQVELQMAQMEATVKELRAKGAKLDAETVATRLEALLSAAQGAGILAVTPGVMPIADELLSSAGFEDQNAPGVLDVAAPELEQPMDPALAGQMPGMANPAAAAGFPQGAPL